MKKCLIICLVLTAFFCLPAFAQYVDKTPSLKVSGSGLYSTAGGDLSNGLNFLALYTDRCYGGIGPVTNDSGNYDRTISITNHNPLIEKWFGLYTNLTHMICADTTISGSYMILSMQYDGLVHIFDSLDLADGDQNGYWSWGTDSLAFDDIWFHYKDDSVLVTVGATNAGGWPVTWAGPKIDDESPTSGVIADSTWLYDGNVQYNDTCLTVTSTDDFSIGFYFSGGERLAGIYIYDTAYSASGFYASADSVMDLYVSDDNVTWTLAHSGITPTGRTALNTVYNKYAATWFPIDYTDCDEKAYQYYKLHCPSGPLRDINGNYLQINEIQPTGNRVMIAGNTADSTSRFAVFSNSRLDWGDARSQAFVPTGAEQVPRFDLPRVDTIICLMTLWMLDKSDSLFSPYDTLGVKCVAIDNMYIGASGSGTNLSAYWLSRVDTSFGGTYTNEVEWELGRANNLTDYGDTLSAGMIRMVEYLADLFEANGYRMILNVSNSTVTAVADYYHVANDSIIGMGKETGGTNLLYYVYNDANFTKVLEIVDTAGSYGGIFNVEFRLMLDQDDDCDIIYPDYTDCDYSLYTASTARLWNNWMADYIMGVQLVIQHGNTSFDYGRALYSGGENLRWNALWEYDMGDTVDSRHDTILNTYHLYYRNLDSGQVWWFPGQTTNSYTDSSLSVSVEIGTGPFYHIFADSTEAVDSAYYSDSTMTMVERHAYILKDASGGPPGPQETVIEEGIIFEEGVTIE